MDDEWMTAREALATVARLTGDWSARATICARAHAGLVQARAARLIIRGRERRPDEARENADMPAKFWWAEGAEALEQNWDTGDFSTWIGEGSGQREWQAFRVHFVRRDIDALSPDTETPEIGSDKPSLPEAALGRWWDTIASYREQMSEENLLKVVRAMHPQNSISRERIRNLTGERKRGPKSFGGKESAK